MSRTTIVTGASGFVGSALLRRLAVSGRSVRGCYRTPPLAAAGGDHAVIGELSGQTDWRAALADADAVVHTAAHAHQLGATSEADFHRVNTEATLNLARQAASAGVRRFVFLSSVKVNGESTQPGRPFRESDVPAPEDAYGRSKRDAEDGLAALARDTGLEVTILRPTLVYGPGARGNLMRLMRLVASGIPLPLGGLRNRRSMIALDNLCGAIFACLEAPGATGRTFLLADGDDLSTPELILRLARAMGRPARLLPVPESVLRLTGRVLRRPQEMNRLIGSLCADGSAITRDLGWQPSRDAANRELEAMAADYLAASGRHG